MDESETENIALHGDFGSDILDYPLETSIDACSQDEIPALPLNSSVGDDWENSDPQNTSHLPNFAFSLDLRQQTHASGSLETEQGNIGYDDTKTGTLESTENDLVDDQYIPLTMASIATASVAATTNVATVGNIALRDCSGASVDETGETIQRKPASHSYEKQSTFHLFDAPLELRTSFLQAQRAYGIEVDPNDTSNLFGMSVNGFHPQEGKFPEADTVRMINAPQQNEKKDKHLKNVKEQKRAQRITSLIEELRTKMEKDGWTSGLRNKVHTLSSCADYVKYLISLNKEKEDKINKVRCDLEAAKAKVEDKKSSLERSDPESTTSSLTVSSNSASKDGRAFVDTTSETSKVIGERGNGPSRRVQLSSGISDLTESNKSSSQPSMESGSDLSPPVVTSTSTSGESTLRSLPHERASISGATLSRQKKRKRKLDDDLTSLDEGFQLDYEEVFLKSNVPQLLATSTGRIVSWNDVFTKITGLSEDDMETLTIFTFTKRNRLSELYELVASILRGSKNTPKNETGRISSLSVPCVYFPDSVLPRSHSLFMTVTVVDSPSIQQQCLHCLFSDKSEDNRHGCMTPEFFNMLAQGYENISPKKKRRAVAKADD